MQNFSYQNSPIKQKTFPVIDLGDIVLRQKQESDAQDFFDYYTDPKVNRYIMCEIPKTLDEARRELLYWRGVFDRSDGIYFGIATKDEDKLIGAIGLSAINTYNSRIELSYDLNRNYWRKGIMSRCIKAVVKYGFEELRINRIEASVASSNIASRDLLRKCGFELEGFLRQHRFHKGTYLDVYFFSMLRREFLANL